MDLLLATLGVAILAVAAADVFRSLLVPRASSTFLRVGPLLSMALFAGWQAMADRVGGKRARQTVRASFAPLMLVLNMVAWAAMLIIGFGLIFWADRANFRPTFRTVGDSFYAAGSAFSTLGVTERVAGDPTRITVLICSVAGLALVTVVATFLISIQSGFGRRETLVLRLESHVALPPAGVAILETYAQEAIVGRLGAFFEGWERWAAEIAISHRAFPILIFFRSNDSRCEWLTALGAVLDAAALLDAAVADAEPAARAGAHFVLRTGARTLRDMAGQFVVDEVKAGPVDEGRFRHHRDRLAAAGYALTDDADAALRRFAEHRGSYGHALLALSRRLRIDVDERTGDDVPRGREVVSGPLEE